MKVNGLRRKTFSVLLILVLALSAFSVFVPQIRRVYATEVFSDGFESGDFSEWNGTTTSSGCTAEVGTANVREGTYSAEYVITLTPTTTSLTQGETVSITVSVTKDGVAFTDYVLNVTKDGSLFKSNIVPANSTFTDQENTATSHTYSVSALYDTVEGEAVSFSVSPVTVYWNVPSVSPDGSTSPSEEPDETEPDDSGADITPSGFEVDEWVILAAGIAVIVLIAVIFVFAVSKEDKRSRGYRW